MKIYTEDYLENFEFWSGAADRANKLTSDEFSQIESILEELYPDGIDATDLNDFFWFDFETIANWIGTTEDEVLGRE